MLYIYVICERTTGEKKGYFISHEYGLQYEGRFRTMRYFLDFYGSEPTAIHKKNKGYFWYEKAKISKCFGG